MYIQADFVEVNGWFQAVYAHTFHSFALQHVAQDCGMFEAKSRCSLVTLLASSGVFLYDVNVESGAKTYIG